MPDQETEGANVRAIRVGVRELRDNLTRYLHDVRDGAMLIVTSHNEGIAEIHPASPGLRPARQPGALRGQIHMAKDFDSLPEDLLSATETSHLSSNPKRCSGDFRMAPLLAKHADAALYPLRLQLCGKAEDQTAGQGGGPLGGRLAQAYCCNAA